MYRIGDKVWVRNSGEAGPQEGVVISVVGDEYVVQISANDTFMCTADMLSPRA